MQLALPPGLKLPHEDLGRAMQWGHVVRDIETTARHYSELFGIGPWIVVTDYSAYRYKFRGQTVQPDTWIAFSYLGDLQIELIQQRNDAPTPYTEFLASGREGLQHIGIFPEDYNAARKRLEGAGMHSIYDIWPPGSDNPTQYYEAPASLGLMIELIEMIPLRRKAFNAIRQTVETWDGTNPIRVYGSMAQFLADEGIAL